MSSDAAWIAAIKAELDRWLVDPDPSGPTSQITGAGAVELAERRFSALHQNRPALMVGNATSGLLAALRVTGAGPGTEVVVPAVDWPGTTSIVEMLGAVPVPVGSVAGVISASAVTEQLSARTVAVVVSHRDGVPVDVPAIAEGIGAVPIIEDCAQAFGTCLGSVPVGCLGDIAAFSFGPGKTIDLGEGGMLLARDRGIWTELVRQVAHPVRQVLAGIEAPGSAGPISRAHPITAVLLANRLRSVTNLHETGNRHAGPTTENHLTAQEHLPES